MAIPQQIIEEIRRRASIVDLVSEHVTLKAAGRRMTGLCPFHQEKTPSFYVRDEEGDYICFGCGKKGSVFDFVMEVRAFSFPEAVRYLAARVGVEVPDESPEQKEDRDKRARLHKVLREIILATAEVYQEELQSNKVAKEYIKKRGLTEESASNFLVGYAPSSWEFLVEKLSAKLKEKNLAKIVDHERFLVVLEKLGLIKKKSGDEASYYDAFRDRLIFPIARSDGAPIALGGRILTATEGAPKYINSPETDIYQKRQTLYGVNRALASLRATRHAYLVEGYMDVISMHQAGLENTLATCGTAITQEHGQTLKRLCDRVTLVFDGDAAGRKAAAKCFEVFLNTGMEISAALLEEGEDPDSLAQKHSKEELEKLYTDCSKPVVDVYLENLFSEFRADGDTASAVICGKAAKRFVRVVSAITNPVEREQVLKQGSDKLEVSLSSLLDLMDQQEAPAPKKAPQPQVKREPIMEAATALKRVSKRDLLEDYYQDLIVSVVLRPTLAAKTLELVKTHKEYDLPKNISSFFDEVSKVGFEISNTSAADSSSDFSKLEELLASAGLDVVSIINEAKKRLTIGGARPEHVSQDILKVISQYNNRQVLSEIRERELEASDEKSLLERAQEKLMARRGE